MKLSAVSLFDILERQTTMHFPDPSVTLHPSVHDMVHKYSYGIGLICAIAILLLGGILADNQVARMKQGKPAISHRRVLAACMGSAVSMFFAWWLVVSIVVIFGWAAFLCVALLALVRALRGWARGITYRPIATRIDVTPETPVSRLS